MFIYKQSIQWHITEKCMNQCRHCYIDHCNKLAELSFSELIKILDNIKLFEEKYHAEIFHYSITGGDPFCYSEFETLLLELSKRQKIISILGIPERVTKESLAKMEAFHVDMYQVSLDGRRMIHDRIRGEGSFDRTIEALRILSESKIKTQVMFTLHNENKDELFQLIDMLDYFKLPISFSFDSLIFEGNGRNAFIPFTAEEFDQICLRYLTMKNTLRENGSRIILREKSKLLETYHVERINNILQPYSHMGGCSCGFDGVSILPNGDVYPCRRLPIKIGNLLTDDYASIFLNSPIMRKLRRISYFRGCYDCEYAKICRGCPALTYSLTGDPLGEMPYCNRKKRVETQDGIVEPDFDCSEEEEFEFISRTLERKVYEEGAQRHLNAVKYDLFKRIRS